MTDPPPALTDRDRILLVGLADGTLHGRRRAAAAALLETIPDGPGLLARQRRVRHALSAGLPTAAPTWAPRRVGWAPRAALASVLAALLLSFAFVRPAGEQPLISQAAALAAEPATAPAHTSVLRAGVDGVAFPDWNREFGWRETGARRDTLGGRVATTVFYEHMGHRLAYTILPGAPVDPPGDARIVHHDGVRIALTRDGDRDVAVFERGGRTCVLAGHVERLSTLVALAAWTG